MSGTFLNKKIFRPTAPDRGSFPLDHDNVCKKLMLDYMVCLSDNQQDNSKCRTEAKEYLGCRMENNLMAKEEWSFLGFQDKKQSNN